MFKKTKEEWEKLSDDAKSMYKLKDDGMYHLDIPETDLEKKLKADVTEFRNTNITLMKWKEEQEAKFKDIDPEEFKKMSEQMQLIKDKKLLEEGNIEELLSQRTEQMQKDFNNRIKSLEEALEAKTASESGLTTRLSEVLVDSNIRDAIGRVGVPKPGAIEDIITRGRKIWKLQDGEPVPMNDDGTILYGTDAKSQMTFDEWGAGLLDSAPHLFEPNKGGGSGGGAGGKGGSGGAGKELMDLPPGERLKVLHSQNS